MEETIPMAWDHYLAAVYTVYALLSVILTIWLARTLGTNGRIFLKDVFPENPALADAVNRLPGNIIGEALRVGSGSAQNQGSRCHRHHYCFHDLFSRLNRDSREPGAFAACPIRRISTANRFSLEIHSGKRDKN